MFGSYGHRDFLDKYVIVSMQRVTVTLKLNLLDHLLLIHFVVNFLRNVNCLAEGCLRWQCRLHRQVSAYTILVTKFIKDDHIGE